MNIPDNTFFVVLVQQLQCIKCVELLESFRHLRRKRNLKVMGKPLTLLFIFRPFCAVLNAEQLLKHVYVIYHTEVKNMQYDAYYIVG